MYGMGNGADKILAVCAAKGITVSDFFASDGFVRGHQFHGKTVLSWNAVKEKYGAENVIVLLSFGSSRPEVLENIRSIAAEAELYAPDVPVFGEGLFDDGFLAEHRASLAAARELLSDEESRRIYDNVVEFKRTGDLSFLFRAESDPDAVLRDLIRPEEITAYADCGAYTGDTVRALLDAAPGLKKVWAMEPDGRNYRKLEAYAAGERRATVRTFPVGVWSETATLSFDPSGNRNASFGENRSRALDGRAPVFREVPADTVDRLIGGERVDYIKYDVEGSEREALLGSVETIRKNAPTVLLSVYHRNGDLFDLPLLFHRLFPDYRGFYLRRFRGVPAWDVNLYLRKEEIGK